MTDEVDANQDRSRRLYEEVFGHGNYAAADDLMAETLASGPTLFRPGSASSGSFGRASRGEFSMDEALVQVSKSCTGRS